MLAIQRYTTMSAITTAFEVCRRHFNVLFSVSLLVSVPSAVAAATIDARAQSAPEDPNVLLQALPVVLLTSVLGSAFATAAAKDSSTTATSKAAAAAH